MKDIEKDIERALQGEFKNKLNSVTYKNKNRLYSLYTKPERHAPAVGKVIFRRAIAAAVCAALLITGTTALAGNRTDTWARFRTAIAQKLSDKGLNVSDKKLDDLTDRISQHYPYDIDTIDISEYDLPIETNAYGEAIGAYMTGADLQKISSYDGSEYGYFYRYDMGIFNELFILPEEMSQMSVDGTRAKIRHEDPLTGYHHNWLYVFAEDGTTILGKMAATEIHYRTNKELEDPKIADDFLVTSGTAEYEKLVEERTRYKLTTGEEMPIKKKEINKSVFPTEGFNDEFYMSVIEGIAVSYDATVVSCDPSMLEVEYVYPLGQESGYPRTMLLGTFHKVGTCDIIITDGDKEYVVEMSCVVGEYGYEGYSYLKSQ